MLDVSTAKPLSTQAIARVTQPALHIGDGWGLIEEKQAMHLALDALVAPVTVQLGDTTAGDRSRTGAAIQLITIGRRDKAPQYQQGDGIYAAI